MLLFYIIKICHLLTELIMAPFDLLKPRRSSDEILLNDDSNNDDVNIVNKYWKQNYYTVL